jgi:hypothetical protein
LFIFQQALQEQIMAMRMGKVITFGMVAASLSLFAQPAFANNKDKTKRAETPAGCTESCKPAVRSMSESTPQRKSDCPRTRRILM